MCQKNAYNFFGSFLFYTRAVDPTILMALSAISAQQSAPTEETHTRVNQFLDYMRMHPNEKKSDVGFPT